MVATAEMHVPDPDQAPAFATVARSRRNWIESLAIVFCSSCALFLLWMAAVNASYSVDNTQMMDAYEADEALIVTKALENHNEHNFDPKGFFDYPYLYPAVGVAIFRYADSLEYNVDSRFAAVTYRTLSMLSAVLCLAAMILLAQNFSVSLPLAVLGGIFLLTIPDFYYWSQMVHPDTLQVAFVLLGFYTIFRSHKLTGALIAAVCFGAAFSVKYAGLLALPFAIVPYALTQLGSVEKGKFLSVVGKLAAVGLLLCAVFAAVFALTNPYAVSNSAGLLKDVLRMKNVVGGVTTVKVANEPLTWVKFVSEFSGFGATSFFAVGCIAGLLTLGLRLGQQRLRDLVSNSDTVNRVTLFTFVLYGFVVQYLLIDKPSPRYSFYFLPLLVLLAVIGISDIARLLGRLSPLLLLALMGMTGVRTDGALQRMAFASNKPLDPVMDLTAFIEDRYKHTDMIVAESGAYVPPVFTNTRIAWGVNQQTIDNLHPDVLILKEGMSGRWAWKRQGTMFAAKDIVAFPGYGTRSEEVRQFLLTLLNNPDWKNVYEKGEFVVFEKSNRTDGGEP